MTKRAVGCGRIVFVTGTDTGVGKTLLTGMLVVGLRQAGVSGLAIKPFCSGGLGDVRLLGALQNDELSAAELNPFYYPEPVAPLVSARRHRRWVALDEVVEYIRGMARRCSVLVVEGSGGLLVPLGEGYAVAEVIAALGCETLVVARNQLGTVNHTLLTCDRLIGGPDGAAAGRGRLLGVALMGRGRADVSCADNAALLRESLASAPVVEVPYLGKGWGLVKGKKALQKKFQKVLAEEKSLRMLCDLVLCEPVNPARPKKSC
jgi:dethiobiotin synthetase